jgi:hypothetical protein
MHNQVAMMTQGRGTIWSDAGIAVHSEHPLGQVMRIAVRAVFGSPMGRVGQQGAFGDHHGRRMEPSPCGAWNYGVTE